MITQATRAILLASATATLGRLALYQARQPRPLCRAVLLRVADHSHRAGDEQPSQVAIALLGYATETILAASRVLLRYQPDPGRHMTA